MKPDAVPSISGDSVDSKRCTRLRFVDLSFDGKDVAFKNEELDNGRLPHGRFKGSKRHPVSPYTFDKGREFQRQLRDDLDLELEREIIGVFGSSPSWALEAHRWSTHSGESPLLAHGFLSPSKLETLNGFGKLPGSQAGKSMRASAPAGRVSNGVEYYRPIRVHEYLAASEMKKAAEYEDLVRYGRPTRTTLLRSRQKLNTSANAYELRRQLDQRMEEIRLSCAFSNPKEFLPLQTDVDGETFYSFITGARYNRAHCLDSKSLSHHGVYMPRHNPLGCFVVPPKEEPETTCTPPDSPRSDTAEDSNPPPPPPEEEKPLPRPTTAPWHGKKLLAPVNHPIPLPPRPTPRQAWSDSAPFPHRDFPTKADIPAPGALKPLLEVVKPSSPHLRISGNRVPINMSREGPLRFEGRLPKLSHLKESAADDVAENNQPLPTPVPAYVKLDYSSLPSVRPETEVHYADAQPHETRKKRKLTSAAQEEEEEEGEQSTEDTKKEEGIEEAEKMEGVITEEKKEEKADGEQETTEGATTEEKNEQNVAGEKAEETTTQPTTGEKSERETEPEDGRQKKEDGSAEEEYPKEKVEEQKDVEESEVRKNEDTVTAETKAEKTEEKSQEEEEGGEREQAVKGEKEEASTLVQEEEKSAEEEEEQGKEQMDGTQERKAIPGETTETQADDTTVQHDVTEHVTDASSSAEDKPSSPDTHKVEEEDGETPQKEDSGEAATTTTAAAAADDTALNDATHQDKLGESDDVKFFVTEGVDIDVIAGGVTTQNEAASNLTESETTAKTDSMRENREGDGEEFRDADAEISPRVNQGRVSNREAASGSETGAQDTDADEAEPLKVVVTHIERKPAVPVLKEEEEEVFAKHP